MISLTSFTQVFYSKYTRQILYFLRILLIKYRLNPSNLGLITVSHRFTSRRVHLLIHSTHNYGIRMVVVSILLDTAVR